MFTRERSGVENNKYTGCPQSLKTRLNNNNNCFQTLQALPVIFNKYTCVSIRVINTWPFNIDSLGFLVVSLEVDWISLAFLDSPIFYCLFMLENKVMTLTQQAFPRILEPRSGSLHIYVRRKQPPQPAGGGPGLASACEIP